MRSQRLAVIAAACLSLASCTFDSGGLTGNSAPPSTTDEQTTGEDSATEPSPTTGNVMPVCGDFQTEGDEECDNGPDNNGGGLICKEDCKLNACGDGYLATATEGCDDGNTAAGDGCDDKCKIEGCGDGEKNENEECDDGNQDDTDGCTTLCKLPVCGDATVQTGEECDDGNNTNDDACTNMCKDAECGDGIVQAGEGCDDGNAVDGDECSNACVSPMCGDGVTQMGEQCDDGNMDDDDDCVSCQDAKCGDASVLMDMEECDDGNMVDTDECTNSCTLPKCGDGVVNGMDMCDDGNQAEDDDCKNDCTPADCGDGIVAKNGNMLKEECDDTNQEDSKDTCNNMCQRIGWWVFVSSEKFTGDEVMGLDEADAKCTQLAMDSSKPIAGKYKAWLSDGATAATDRLAKNMEKLVLPNNALTKVADDWNDMTDMNGLDAAISIDENGDPITVPDPAPNGCMDGNAAAVAVWTGTMNNGMKVMSDHCDDWSNGTDLMTGRAGLLNNKDGEWSGCAMFACDIQARLYCIEQP